MRFLERERERERERESPQKLTLKQPRIGFTKIPIIDHQISTQSHSLHLKFSNPKKVDTESRERRESERERERVCQGSQICTVTVHDLLTPFLLASPHHKNPSIMPSGAKKRKSAKKKQQKEEANNNKNNSAIHSLGDDDPKVHDEKESDGGEAGSLASQDHHNHSHPFTEGEEEEMEKREDTLTVRSIVTESEPVVGISGNGKSTPNVAMDANSDIQIDKEMKRVDDSDSKNVSIEYVESVKESNGGQMSLDLGKNVSIGYVESVKESNSGRVSLDGGNSSSGSSSSDDESHVIEKNVVVIESGESKADDPNLAAESAAFADPVKPADLPEVTQATDGVPVMDACNLVVGEPKEEAYDPVAANAPPINLVEPSDFAEITPVTVGDLVIEGTTSLVDSENVSKTVVPVNDSLAIENSMHSTMFELGLKESGKNESSGVSPVVMDMGSQPKEDKVASKADENSSVSSGTGFATQEDEQVKPLASSSILAVDHSNGAGHVKDSVISECSDGQPLVASAPRLARTTSWMSCCGIFELFIGSSR